MSKLEGTMEERFIELMRGAAWQAGAVARYLQDDARNRGKGGHRSPESSALTAVDLATQDVILHRLREDMPEVAVDAEEDTELARSFPPAGDGRPLIVLDPIDGTLNYTRGSSEYAVMGSLLVGDRMRAALVHFPAYGSTYWAIAGRGCFEQKGEGAPERVRCREAPARVLVTPGAGSPVRDALGAAGFEVRESRCSAVDAMIPVLGWAQASVSTDGADRRRAVGFLLTLEAGGAVRLGERGWRGEDMAADDPVPAVVAPSHTLAERIVATVRGSGSI